MMIAQAPGHAVELEVEDGRELALHLERELTLAAARRSPLTLVLMRVLPAAGAVERDRRRDVELARRRLLPVTAAVEIVADLGDGTLLLVTPQTGFAGVPVRVGRLLQAVRGEDVCRRQVHAGIVTVQPQSGCRDAEAVVGACVANLSRAAQSSGVCFSCM